MSRSDFESARQGLLSQGFVVVPFCLGWNDESQKKHISGLPVSWGALTLEAAQSMHQDAKFNALAVLTGVVSDLIVLDVDLPAMDVWADLLSRHPLPDNVPRVRTQSGGEHLWFSLSANEHAGLKCNGNQQGLVVNGSKVCIDVRGAAA